MTIVRQRERISLNNNNLSIQTNTYSLDLYDYVNLSVSLFSPFEFKIDSTYKRHYRNKNKIFVHSDIQHFNNIDLL